MIDFKFAKGDNCWCIIIVKLNLMITREISNTLFEMIFQMCPDIKSRHFESLPLKYFPTCNPRKISKQLDNYPLIALSIILSLLFLWLTTNWGNFFLLKKFPFFEFSKLTELVESWLGRVLRAVKTKYESRSTLLWKVKRPVRSKERQEKMKYLDFSIESMRVYWKLYKKKRNWTKCHIFGIGKCY